MSAPTLSVRLLGRPEARCGEEVLSGLRRKGLALLCYLAHLGRPAPRASLAMMFWGEGRLANLRQELAALRRLPGAARWLEVDDGWVAIHATTDLEGLSRGRVPPGDALPLEGLDLPDAPDFEAWRDALTVEVEAARQHASPLAGGAAAVAPPVVALLAELLSLAGPDGVPMRVLERALELPAEQIARAEALLRARGRRDHEAVRPASASSQRWLGLAWWHAVGPVPEAEALLRAAGATQELARLWLERARTGDPDAATRALPLCGPEDRPEALRLATEAAIRGNVQEDAARHLEALAVLARDTQDPALLLEVSLLRVRQALGTGRLRRAAEDLHDARALVAQQPLPDGDARVALWTGQLAMLAGQPAEAEAALRVAAAGGHPWSRAAALASLGALAARQQGRLEDAVALHDEALAAVRGLGDRAAAARMLNNVGATAERIGRLRAARACFADALGLAEQLGDTSLQLLSALNQAEIERRLGRLGTVRTLLARVFAHGMQALPARHLALALQIRGDLERCCGRYEEAEVWLVRAAEAWARGGDTANEEMAGWLVALTREGRDLGPAAWDRLADALSPRRIDLVTLAWDELLRRAPDAPRAERALAARTALQGEPVPALRALPALLRGELPAHDWLPEDEPEASFDEVVAVACWSRGCPDGLPLLERLLAGITQGLLPGQCAALRRSLGLTETPPEPP